MYGCHEWTALCYLLGSLRYSTCRSHCLWPRKVCVFKNTCRDWPSLTTFTPGMFKKTTQGLKIRCLGVRNSPRHLSQPRARKVWDGTFPCPILHNIHEPPPGWSSMWDMSPLGNKESPGGNRLVPRGWGFNPPQEIWESMVGGTQGI